MKRWRSFLVLFAVSLLFAVVINSIGLPAGWLLGPMIAAIMFVARGGAVSLPAPFFMGGQAVVGLMIAPSISATNLGVTAHQPLLFLGATLVTLAASAATGVLLARFQVLPGSAAVWGSMPGAATPMVLMAKDAGADWQLVAVMTYLRVVLVATFASVLAAFFSGHLGSHALDRSWFSPVDPVGLGETLVMAVAGIWVGRRVGLPAAAMLGPMMFGAALELTGLVHPQLPGWLLAPAYALMGWRIGLGFTPASIAVARRAAPQLLLAIGLLIGFCAGCGLLLARVSGESVMTAYLAMSPGGADSVAIIASAACVNVPFIMMMQVLRMVVVLLIGPYLVRTLARGVERRLAIASAQKA